MCVHYRVSASARIRAGMSPLGCQALPGGNCKVAQKCQRPERHNTTVLSCCVVGFLDVGTSGSP